jgi:hypothetical protein
VASFTPWPLYLQGKNPWYPLYRRLRLDAVVRRKIPKVMKPASYMINASITL